MKDNFKTLGEALGAFTQNKKIKKQVTEVRIVSFWGELMGDLVNKYTEKIFLKNKTLFIKVGPDALKNELLYSKETIIEKMQKEFGNDVLDKMVLL